MTRSRRGPSGSLRRHWAPICVAGALLAALLCAAAPAGAEAPAFCQKRFARDYEAPLREMPRQHPPPEGELPFGPRNFGIHRIDRTPLAFEGSRFGYRFGGKNEGSRVLNLNWRAAATARAVDARGRVGRVVGREGWRVHRVKDLDSLEIAFSAERPGFYRVDLRIATLDGRRRIAYRDYFRVLRRSNDVSIGVSAESVRPGESVWGLLENRGAGQLSTRGYLDLERVEGGVWVPVPLPPSPESVMGITWLIGPGEVGRCQRFDVPVDAAPGPYRFSVPVNLANTQRRVTATGRFAVSP